MTESNRCAWCLSDPLYIAYHDTEWGKAIYDDKRLFALLCLEGMQAGLNWLLILKRREAYYRAFDGFNPDKIAQYDAHKIDALLNNPKIIRHQGKILAIIQNAKAYLAIQQTRKFSDYLWQMVSKDKQPRINQYAQLSEIPSQTPTSIQMAKQLKKDGFRFVGAKICYAFMQAAGMVDDHISSCPHKTPTNP